MTDTVTRCPECSTAFKITLSQLELAQGAVRCGSCLQVFMASDNIVEDLPSNPASDSDTSDGINIDISAQALAEAEAEKIEEEDELFKHMDALESLEPEYEPLTESEPPEAGPAQAQRAAGERQTQEPLYESIQEEAAPTQDSLADENFAINDVEITTLDLSENTPKETLERNTQAAETEQPEELDTKPQPEPRLELGLEDMDSSELEIIPEPEPDKPLDVDNAENEAGFDTSFEQQFEPTDTEERFIDDASEIQLHDQGNHGAESLTQAFNSDDSPDVFDDEAWARDILDELETDDKDSLLETMSASQPPSIFDKQTPVPELDRPQDDEQDQVLDFSNEPDDIELDDRQAHESELHFDNFSENNYSEPPTKDQLLNNIRPEPIELRYQKPERSLLWLWATACILAILGLSSQIAYINFDRYNHIEPYRQWYGATCKLLDCKLPPKQDLKQIKAYNLMIRSHVNVAQALHVDLVILNTAEFIQDFPALKLSFSDDNNQIIASRSFQPREYLAGELAGSNSMPTQQPIHLSLSILDPGESAVNYQIEPVRPAP